MKTWKRRIAFVACSLLLAGASACVEQEPSMSLEGNIALEGTVDDNGILDTCEVVFAEDPERINTRGVLDIEQLKTFGQAGAPINYSLADEETGQTIFRGHSSYVFYALIQNLLEESTQVGAGGGGGDNFEGLKEDQNSIMLTGATVRFPTELNKFDGAELASSLEKKELFSAVLDSNGGGVLLDVPIFSQREISTLEEFYSEAVQRAGYPADATTPIVPLVAEIQIEGETFSGREVESNKFQYPIEICRNCDLGVTSTCYVTE